MYLVSLYDFSKDNCDLLKPGFHAMEGTIKTIIGLVYSKLHDIPLSSLSIIRSSLFEVNLPSSKLRLKADEKTKIKA